MCPPTKKIAKLRVFYTFWALFRAILSNHVGRAGACPSNGHRLPAYENTQAQYRVTHARYRGDGRSPDRSDAGRLSCNLCNAAVVVVPLVVHLARGSGETEDDEDGLARGHRLGLREMSLDQADGPLLIDRGRGDVHVRQFGGGQAIDIGIDTDVQGGQLPWPRARRATQAVAHRHDDACEIARVPDQHLGAKGLVGLNVGVPLGRTADGRDVDIVKGGLRRPGTAVGGRARCRNGRSRLCRCRRGWSVVPVW